MAQVAKISDAKKKEERKALFSQKTLYVGPTSSLALYVREAPNGRFKCYALFEKKGAEKKDKGMVTDHATQADAVKKYDELAAQCVVAGWKAKSSSKSSFDTIPAAE